MAPESRSPSPIPTTEVDQNDEIESTVKPEQWEIMDNITRDVINYRDEEYVYGRPQVC
jgi:hypothetical protein